MPDRMAWRRMVGSAISDTVGGLPEVGEAVLDRMAWRRMVGSAINDTVGGYQKKARQCPTGWRGEGWSGVQ